MAGMDRSRAQNAVGKTAVFVETYVFSLIYVLIAIQHGFTLYENRDLTMAAIANIDANSLNHLSNTAFLAGLGLFCLLTAYSLIIRKNLQQTPQGFLELFVPLVATFNNYLYNFLPYLPQDANYTLLPAESFVVVVPLGFAIVLTGLTISIAALYYLRRSFGIFVQVRDIVTRGLFRHTRHPMYFGYTVMHIGLLLVRPKLYNLLFSWALISLLVYRARLEERKLDHHSPEYREYKRTVPFLIPFSNKLTRQARQG
jgi:protein-S-isoprenylcysteine O-methyltransferase Ste14